MIRDAASATKETRHGVLRWRRRESAPSHVPHQIKIPMRWPRASGTTKKSDQIELGIEIRRSRLFDQYSKIQGCLKYQRHSAVIHAEIIGHQESSACSRGRTN
ncbi:uncharacterized protein LOC124405063 [Diprion similis]|uniref:uncharacterized protein LOC124405063 n=1 Tax=Diprion similis TaxID=362088 RepID=UPI001EF87991|nr:uncharacterized protein LOC124405063 [Diprion similis]